MLPPVKLPMIAGEARDIAAAPTALTAPMVRATTSTLLNAPACSVPSLPIVASLIVTLELLMVRAAVIDVILPPALTQLLLLILPAAANVPRPSPPTLPVKVKLAP